MEFKVIDCVDGDVDRIEEIRNLRSIIGKHVYEKRDGQYIKLCIE